MACNDDTLPRLDCSVTLEDLQEKGCAIAIYCSTCNRNEALELDRSVQALGRAFPLYLLNTKLELLGIAQCHPETRLRCLAKLSGEDLGAL